MMRFAHGCKKHDKLSTLYLVIPITICISDLGGQRMILSYKYRLSTTEVQAAGLDCMLADFCELYNAALEHRISAYRKGVSIGRNEQITALPQIRRDLPHQSRWSAAAQQQVLRRLDFAYSAFFGRVRSGGPPGFPRYRSKSRFHAVDFRFGNGVTIKKGGRLSIRGIEGGIKVRWHRSLPAKPKTATITRQVGKWYAIFRVEVAATSCAGVGDVGIDLGLNNLATLSNGETVARPGWSDRAAKEMRRRRRALRRCQSGSKSRTKRRAAFSKFNARVAARRRDHLHRLSHRLVLRFGRMAIEDLGVKGLAAGMLAKHVRDASWATLVSMISYKAANAGGQVIKVDPRGTSQTCPGCGAVAKKTLRERMHRCDCGCTLDRDVAAAMVVYFRAFGFWPGSGHESLSEPVAA